MRRTAAIDVMPSASVADCVEQSHRLARLVSASYEPHCVVAVLNGGLLPAMTVARDLGLEDRLLGLRVKRKRDMDGIYRYVPKTAAKLIQGMYYLFSRPVVEPFDGALSGRRVLVVDDRADTEASLKAAVEWLWETGNPASVRTAVLSWLGRWPPRMPPDFYVHKGMMKFPWSANAGVENPDYHAEYDAFIRRHAAYLISCGIEIGPRAAAGVAA
jgi:hypoxanthine phosphoribosyltransferase